MASEEPSTKRKRIEQDEVAQPPVSTPPTYERPVDFWIDDGNVVLEAEQTQFRVHRSMLRSNSSFFSDMFDLPQPQTAPMVEGCYLVHCAGDAAQDWLNVLMFIYHPLKLSKPLSISFLASMVRLGKKYQFDLIRNEAVRQFKDRIPSTLKQWSATMNPLRSPSWNPGYLAIRSQEFDFINIAEEVGIPSILPALYYLCAVNMTVDVIFDGLTRVDGTTSHLSLASQRLIVVGQSKILNLMTRHTLSWVFSGAPSDGACLTPEGCSRQRSALVRQMPTIVCSLRLALEDFKNTKPKFCSPCMERAEQMHQDGQLKFWKELPLLFGLPNWEDIKDFVD